MPTPKKSTVKDESAFDAVHAKSKVLKAKVAAGIQKLGASGWEYDDDFRKQIGISAADLGKLREDFPGFWFTVKFPTERKVWCGSKALATRLQAKANG